MEQTEWVDFRAVKAAVSMQEVIEHYKITGLRKQGEDLRGICPICNTVDKRGLSVNYSKNVFQCFVCKARGNVLDFVAKMEKCTVKDAALKLQKWFLDSEVETEKIEPPDIVGDTSSDELFNMVNRAGALICEAAALLKNVENRLESTRT
jgi:DNA primase